MSDGAKIDGRAFWRAPPAYILDLNYHFLEWNWAFDEVVAKPLGISKLQHATDFIRAMDNRQEVLARSARVFAIDKTPRFDMEPLLVTIEPYGQVCFRKVASMIATADGEPEAWAIFLNIDSADNEGALWAAIQARIERELANEAP